MAIAGIGNSASSLLQGVQYYSENGNSIGLLHEKLGGYTAGDIKLVAAFDIDKNKIGKDVSEAIHAEFVSAITPLSNSSPVLIIPIFITHLQIPFRFLRVLNM